MHNTVTLCPVSGRKKSETESKQVRILAMKFAQPADQVCRASDAIAGHSIVNSPGHSIV